MIAPLNYFEIEELLRGMFAIPDDEEIDCDQLVLDKFDCSYEAFVAIVDNLMPLAVESNGLFSGNYYKGFGKDGVFFIKRSAGAL